jgi:hypothetical protein
LNVGDSIEINVVIPSSALDDIAEQFDSDEEVNIAFTLGYSPSYIEEVTTPFRAESSMSTRIVENSQWQDGNYRTSHTVAYRSDSLEADIAVKGGVFCKFYLKAVQAGSFYDAKLSVNIGNDWFEYEVTVTPASGGGDNPANPDPEIKPGAIDVVADYGGTIVFDNTTGGYSITATGQNYVIDKIVVDGVELTDVQRKSEYAVTSENAPERSIVALFAYTINFSSPAGGTLSVSRGDKPLTSGDIVRGGEVLTITAAPDSGYELYGELELTGLARIGEKDTYTVTAQQSEATPSVAAVFASSAPEEYSVTIADLTNGAVTAGKSSAAAGETVTLTVAPETDYRLKSGSLKVNGGAVTVSGTDPAFTFTMPADDVTVTAEFEQLPEIPWEGTGTETDPYKIASNTDMIALRDKVNAGESCADAHFLLTGDLDLTKSEASWTPIGKRGSGRPDAPFSGVFDGGNHKITVIIDDTTTATGGNIGLFGYVTGAKVRNLALYGSVKGYSTVGGIIGRGAGGHIIIENCENHADVSAASESSAGIIASAQIASSVTIINCKNYGSTSAVKSLTAGILSVASSTTTVTGCVNYGNINGVLTGSGSTGIGIADGGAASNRVTISNCANLGNVQGLRAAGIGYATLIEGCYNAGTITGWSLAGGISAAVSTGTIKNSYNAGAVSVKATSESSGGHNNAGGIASYSKGIIENCYNSGAITGEVVGGIASEYTNPTTGIYTPTVTNSYYLASSVTGGADIGTSVTDAQLRELAATLGTAFESSEDGYPVLAWQLGDDSASKTQTVSDGVVTATIKGGDLTGFTDEDGGVYASFDLRGGETVNAVNATVKNRTLEILSEASATLRLNTDAGNFTFDSASLAEISAAAGTSDITFTAAKLSSSSNAAAQTLITSGAPVYEFTLKAGDTPVFTGASNKGAVSVILPYTRQGTAQTVTVKVYHIAENGTKTEVPGATYSNGDKVVSFETNHFSLYSVEEIARETGAAGSGDPGSGAQGKPDAPVWDGETIDVRWYTPGQSTYYISDAADLAGLAAIVNGIYNEDIIYIVGDDNHTKIKANWSEDLDPNGPNGNNMSTERYCMGADDFAGKTVILTADINMGAANYMPIGGQYLMAKNDSTTKISSSFNGTFDGGGHSVTLYTDRHCSNGNYGDGSSVGLIGRLGVHDGEAGSVAGDPDLRAQNPTVKNVAVYGSVHANRSVGGIVGKIGKTLGGGIIENCANFADVSNTDAKGVGGIVGAGWNGGIIRNCYNTGNISSTYACPAGGISGSNEITIENCYNVGNISAASASFAMSIGTNNGGAPYDTHVINSYFLAGTAPGGGYFDGKTAYGEGFTAEYMKSDDFVADLNAGAENGAYVKDTRNINNGYPIFEWQGGTAVAPSVPDTNNTTTDKPETAAPSTTVVNNGEATVMVDIPDEDVPLSETPEKYVITVNTEGEDVDRITVEIPKEVIAIEAGSRSEIEIRSEIADILLPDKAVAALAETGETITVKAAKNEDSSCTFTIAAGDKTLDTIDGGIKVVIPTEDAAPGVVAVIVHADGTEEVVKKSVSKDGKVTIPLDGSATIKIIDNGKSYADAPPEAWYADAVAFATSHELFQGTAENIFSPDAPMTRGMLVTVLHRLEDTPEAAGELFPDVEAGAWYAEAIIWADVSGIVNGTGNGFEPDAEITREQLAVMLYRYAAWTDIPATAEGDNMTGYPDADSVSDWAESSVIWAVSAGLIQGRDGGVIAPQGTATRAEVATILQRFIENLI